MAWPRKNHIILLFVEIIQIHFHPTNKQQSSSFLQITLKLVRSRTIKYNSANRHIIILILLLNFNIKINPHHRNHHLFHLLRFSSNPINFDDSKNSGRSFVLNFFSVLHKVLYGVCCFYMKYLDEILLQCNPQLTCFEFFPVFKIFECFIKTFI